MGRKAPLEAFVALCQRHRFESQILPEAESKGWPKEIEFDKLEKRVRKLKRDLKALITDEEVRRHSKFWMEVMTEVKAKGTRAMTGVRNQFANFDKMQPGYYGEQGSVIIQHTLFDMFPPATINLNDIKPLNANEFMQRILVPEVAKSLIMEDQNVAPAKAIKILRESTTYGVAMFPE
ncbi:RTC4-like domain-containing protein, partial [Mucidula mucida]